MSSYVYVEKNKCLSSPVGPHANVIMEDGAVVEAYDRCCIVAGKNCKILAGPYSIVSAGEGSQIVLQASFGAITREGMSNFLKNVREGELKPNIFYYLYVKTNRDVCFEEVEGEQVALWAKDPSYYMGILASKYWEMFLKYGKEATETELARIPVLL